MSKKIATLYAEIGADTTKLKSGLDETKGKLTQAKQGFDNFKASILPAIGIVAGFGAALKGAYDMAKEGAALEFAAGKFDRLADSIGVTSDALLGDLRKATRGTVDDMTLMGSAGDFMALGLAKSHDEVVRLTRVAGALGMDMNQLVLTLTNQTTMRFDALGVSVDGFDAKVEALKATGMDANKAFTEAFLQQAEEQIGKVGDKADTAAGQMAIFEANIANINNSMKSWVAEGVNPLMIALNKLMTGTKEIRDLYKDHREEVWNTATSYQDYITEMERAVKVSGALNYGLIQSAGGWEEARAQLGLMTEEQWNAAKSLESYTEKEQLMLPVIADATSATDGLTTSTKNLATAAGDVNTLMQEYTTSLLFNKAAAGLDAEGALALAEAMGLVEEDTKIAMEALDLLKEKYDKNKDGALDATEATSGYTEAVAGLDEMIRRLQDKKITVTTEFINEYINTSGRGDSGGYGGWTGQERASGGPVIAGTPYLVGERGPELFVPGQSGNIVNAQDTAAMGANVTITQNIYTQLDYEIAAAEIMERIRRNR